MTSDREQDSMEHLRPSIKQLRIRNLAIDPPLALAPMVGLSHTALRSLLAEIGGIGLYYTEMLSAKRLPTEDKNSPFLTRTSFERPLFYQLYANERCDIATAVERIEAMDAQGIDLNLGCPAPQLRKIGAGKYLLERPGAAQTVLKKLRTCTELPVSVKIRIGDRPVIGPLLETCKILEGEGVDLITVHARLTHEKFCRRPRWSILEKITAQLKTPILANGGIFSVGDARKCLVQSGAAGLMIGRGAVQNLRLARDIASDIYGYRLNDTGRSEEELYFQFISLVEQRFAPERRLGRLKQFTHYFAQKLSFGHSFAAMIQSSTSMREATDRAHEFFSDNSDVYNNPKRRMTA